MLSRRRMLAGLGGAAAAPVVPAFADIDVASTFRDLLYGNEKAHLDAVKAFQTRGGLDLVPGLIFVLRFARVWDGPILQLLAELTGETDRSNWHDWMRWQELHPEVIPHESYIDLKRDFFFKLDPNFEIFLKTEYLDRAKMKIRFEEITFGGVRKDGIPSLDSPDLIDAKDALFMLGHDLVFGIEIDGDVRAYPLRIMGWHEMFNDVIGGVPLALAYCTLCGAGILFETQLPDRADPLVFGSSGFLYRSNKLMFDRGTHSLWNQFTGQPVMGPLVDSGIKLKQRPLVIEPWIRWTARHPDTKVLSLNTGHERDYGSGVVYEKYFASPKLMFPTNVDETRLKQKDYVFGIRTFGAAKAWPVTAFEGGRVINDRVGDLKVVLVGDRLGRTVRAYESGGLVFELGDGPKTLRQSGDVWKVTEEFLIGPSGARLPRVAGHIAYWFAWDGYLGRSLNSTMADRGGEALKNQTFD